MKTESKLLANALLVHHRQVVAAHPPGKTIVAGHYSIAYGVLCQRAGVPNGPIIGAFLREVAEWCAAEGHPALNSLAVNATSGIPGEGYDGAGGFQIIHWPAELDRCVRYRGYPATFP